VVKVSQPKRDRSISIGTASIISTIVVIPILLLLTVVYSVTWGVEDFFEGLTQFTRWQSFLPAILLGVPIHEGIHGLTWMWLGKVSRKHIKFGVKYLTPYAHCEIPMSARAYRTGAMMPAAFLGLLPYSIGLLVGNGWLTVFGLVFLFAAGGDLLILWILRSVKADAMVEDHPSRVGCYVYD
jgi:hypothetical protein